MISYLLEFPVVQMGLYLLLLNSNGVLDGKDKWNLSSSMQIYFKEKDTYSVLEVYSHVYYMRQWNVFKLPIERNWQTYQLPHCVQ